MMDSTPPPEKPKEEEEEDEDATQVSELVVTLRMVGQGSVRPYFSGSVSSGPNYSSRDRLVDDYRRQAFDAGGITSSMRAGMDNARIDPSEILFPGLYQVTFRTPIAESPGNHNHYILVAPGLPTRILSGAESSGRLVVLDENWLDSKHGSEEVSGSLHELRLVGAGNVETAWSDMREAAARINNSAISYTFQRQNSNSAFHYVSDAGGITPFNAGGMSIGYSTDLQVIIDDPSKDDPGTTAPFSSIEGSDASDTLAASSGRDVVYGYAGNDDITSSGGVVFGGGGDDRILIRVGTADISGGEGDDNIVGGPGADFIMGDAGRTVLLLPQAMMSWMGGKVMTRSKAETAMTGLGAVLALI